MSLGQVATARSRPDHARSFSTSVPPHLTLRWWLVAYAAFVTPIDFSRVGLASGGDLDAAKWLFRLPVWFLPLVLVAPRWGQLLDAFRRPPTSWLLLWASFGVVSVLWAFDGQQAVIIGLGIAGLIVLGTWYVWTSGWDSFATAALLGTAAVTLAGTVRDGVDGTLIEGRSLGLTSGPTTQARLAALTIVLAAGLYASGRSRGWAVAAVVAAGPAMVFSETRTTAVALFVGLLYGALREVPRATRLAMVGAIVALVVLVVGFGVGVENLTRASEQDDPTSLTGRTSIWPVAVDLIEAQPILGYGSGSSKPLFDEAARSGRTSFQAATAHMIPLAALVAGGVVGFSLLACAVGSALRNRRRVSAWVMAPLLVILVSGITESIVHLPSTSLLIIAGVLAAVTQSVVDQRSKAPMS